MTKDLTDKVKGFLGIPHKKRQWRNDHGDEIYTPRKNVSGKMTTETKYIYLGLTFGDEKYFWD